MVLICFNGLVLKMEFPMGCSEVCCWADPALLCLSAAVEGFALFLPSRSGERYFRWIGDSPPPKSP